MRASDAAAGLDLVTEIEALPGGLLRARHTVTSTGAGSYHLTALDVVLPAADDLVEVLDFTGRHEGERTPQRRPVDDGLWLRESRTGVRRARLGHGARGAARPAWVRRAARSGACHVAWSGNTVHRLERTAPHGLAATTRTLGGGELLLPGEVELGPGGSPTRPRGCTGRGGRRARRPGRHLPTGGSAGCSGPPGAAPAGDAQRLGGGLVRPRPGGRLTRLADLAAEVGVERFVLDDGWFGARRDDHAAAGRLGGRR